MNNIELAEALYDELFGNKPYATLMHDMFSDNIDFMWDYIKVGRQFWDYNEIKGVYELITITYKRSGVAFYTTEGSVIERYFLRGSAHHGLLYPRVVYVEDLKAFAKEFLNDSDDNITRTLQTMKPYTPADYVQIDVEF